MEVTFFMAFLAGLIIGASPCILLMLSTFGTSLILVEDKGKFLKISIGLLSGMLLTYIVISILFLYFIEFFKIFTYFKYIFAGILISIGIWQIIECKKEQSKIFGTPEKVKTILKDFIERNSGFYAFLVGILFVLIKIPCFGTIYLVLLYNLQANPLLYLYIITYLIGMVIPIILVLILLRLGLESNKIDDFRLKYRPHLRFLNGAILIFLAFYLLILDDFITNLL
ncbi:MAG: cytochrome c biogenesis CcdA family protein [Promethearchaeota archaeon]